MRKDEIFEKIAALISTISDAQDITEDSEIIEDLGIGSMDVLYLISCLEAEFGIKIPERAFRGIEVVGDMVDVVNSYIK